MNDPGDETDFHDVAGANVNGTPKPKPTVPKLINGEHTLQVLTDVGRERARQDSKWGLQDHDFLYWYAVLGEEYGEAGEAILDYVDERGEGVPFTAYEDHLREELLHVAAVAVAAIETLDRFRANRDAILSRMPPGESDAWRSHLS